MSRLKTFILSCLAALVLAGISAPLLAQDSGLYFDPDRDGEGMYLLRDGDFLQIGIFSYKAWQGCPGVNFPYFTLLDEENCHFNRWFISGGDHVQPNSDGVDQVSGDLLIGYGYNWPEGIGIFGEPFAVKVGDAFKVGTFVLQRYEQGWRLSVDHYSGGPLSDEDPLFHMNFYFRKALIRGKN